MEEFEKEMLRLGVTCLIGVSGASLTTFGSGGKVRCLLLPKSTEELRAASRLLKERGVPGRVIGGGSNILLPDEGYDCALVRLSAFDAIRKDGTVLTVGAGVKLPILARFAAENSLSGAEFACGIPAHAGGAAATGAGAYGQGIADLLLSVTAMSEDGRVEVLPAESLKIGYHRAALPKGWVLLSLRLGLSRGDKERIKATMRSMRQKRLSSQPHLPSAGSVFAPVEGVPAALYIEKTGLKGARVGGAELSDRHCNFIVNAGGATTQDYFALAERVKKEVRERCGVLLAYEVERICLCSRTNN